ncbi:M14 family zinc carboxypeptidase [Acetivibrio sp. MSJd-27]|uniref:M14 family zinc carboxypeptidase n=1 Tax=Acetivibrio sp. MSJd-27 TaxID=2841523 RepID=UPI001C123BB5|nr:M14 family zinc carboxypeptidase [Acetivibrio sp. MSJd-27]MBU5449423.1 hypothetical protein [Acetivibrio sp. MSJd-27]
MYENYINYNYDKLSADLNRLQDTYPFLNVCTFGKSVQKRELFRIRMGKGKKYIHLNGAHHGMEWITSALLVQFISDISNCAFFGEPFLGENASRLLSDCTLDIVPMVNPDGVEYSQCHKQLNWQSNANGVDLNHNYPAKFYEGKLLEEEAEIFGPCASRFSGYHPLDQPETYSMSKLICSRVPDMVIAFHSQGKEIYYEFDGRHHKDALKIARQLADAAGYEVSIPSGFTSYSGMKDWVIDRFLIPAFTVEVGEGENPLPMEQFPQILDDNYKLIVKAMKL